MTTPSATPTHTERSELIAAWMELIGITECSELDVDAEWTLNAMNTTAITGFHPYELECAEPAWNFAMGALGGVRDGYDPLAAVSTLHPIDATIGIAYELHRVAPVRRHIERMHTSPDRFLHHLFINILRLREPNPPAQDDADEA